MLAEFNHRRPDDKNCCSVGLFQFDILGETVVFPFLKQRLDAFEKHVAINNLLVPFPTVNVVVPSKINFLAVRLL